MMLPSRSSRGRGAGLGLAIPTVEKPVSLREQVFEHLRRAIISRQLPPGELVSEQYIANLTGASRTPVREALLQLATEGLVEFIRHAGVRIKLLDPEFLDQTFMLRASIEGFCARRIAGLDDQGEAMLSLEGELARQRDIRARRDHLEWIEANTAFHQTLVEYGGNNLMLESLDRLRSHTQRMGYHVTEARDTRMDQAFAEHERIVSAIGRRDPLAAQHAVEGHLFSTAKITREILTREADAGNAFIQAVKS